MDLDRRCPKTSRALLGTCVTCWVKQKAKLKPNSQPKSREHVFIKIIKIRLQWHLIIFYWDPMWTGTYFQKNPISYFRSSVFCREGASIQLRQHETLSPTLNVEQLLTCSIDWPIGTNNCHTLCDCLIKLISNAFVWTIYEVIPHNVEAYNKVTTRWLAMKGYNIN